MIKIVKKAPQVFVCGLRRTVVTPMIKKERKIERQTIVSGLNSWTYENGKRIRDVGH